MQTEERKRGRPGNKASANVMNMRKYISFVVCTVSSLKVLLKALHPVCASWYNIGLELDIPHITLDCFKLNYSLQLDLLREVLRHWLDTAVDPRPTWEAVVTALKSPIVDEKYIAEQLESMFCAPMQCVKESTKVERSEGVAIL